MLLLLLCLLLYDDIASAQVHTCSSSQNECLTPTGLIWILSAGQKLLDCLAETWDFFFCDVLSTLQAVFYPVQVCLTWLVQKYTPEHN